ncbi:MAG: orotidine 5'-phosphate decarboxylase, partial [Clostridiales bacterium]|nr:orotidine 5'-phosphate decarboxylase [Clostridiales bacterium]
MKLQLALDLYDIDKGLEMVHKTKDYVDVFELGTGFMGAHGYELVKIFRAAFPDIQLLADVKTVDGGYSTSKKMFDYG